MNYPKQIRLEGPLGDPSEIRVFDAATGYIMPGVRWVELRLAIGQPTTARIHILRKDPDSSILFAIGGDGDLIIDTFEAEVLDGFLVMRP